MKCERTMKKRSILLLVALLFSTGLGAAADTDERIRTLVITGGHGFETNQFYRLFDENKEIKE